MRWERGLGYVIWVSNPLICDSIHRKRAEESRRAAHCEYIIVVRFKKRSANKNIHKSTYQQTKQNFPISSTFLRLSSTEPLLYLNRNPPGNTIPCVKDTQDHSASPPSPVSQSGSLNQAQHHVTFRYLCLFCIKCIFGLPTLEMSRFGTKSAENPD